MRLYEQSRGEPQRASIPSGPVSYRAFLEWADEDTLAEWVDGEIVVASPASLRHQQLLQFLLAVLELYVKTHGLGSVIAAPFQMKLRRTGREPDILFVATAHLGRLKPTLLGGPADLVIELVSPESRERDTVEKLAEYEEAGVQEYWIIDHELRQARFHELQATGNFLQIQPEADGLYRSKAVPGFWLRTDWLWHEPIPDAIPTLLEIDRDATTAYLEGHLRR